MTNEQTARADKAEAELSALQKRVTDLEVRIAGSWTSEEVLEAAGKLMSRRNAEGFADALADTISETRSKPDLTGGATK